MALLPTGARDRGGFSYNPNYTKNPDGSATFSSAQVGDPMQQAYVAPTQQSVVRAGEMVQPTGGWEAQQRALATASTPSDGGAGGGAVPSTAPTASAQMGAGISSDASAAMLSLDAATQAPETAMPSDGNMLRMLGRRSYPVESSALASMGRIY